MKAPVHMVRTVMLLIMVCGAVSEVQTEPYQTPDEGYFWEHPEEIRVAGTDMAFTSEIFNNVKNQNIFFMTQFNDGWVFMTSFFGFRTRSGFIKRWGIYVVVTDPAGNSYFAKLEMKDRDIEFAEDRLYITDGTNWIEGSGMEYRVHYDFEGFYCDLTFNNILPPWKPGDGKEVFTEDGDVFERRTVNSPWADVSGVIRYGDTVHNVKGEGYSEYSILIVPFRRMNPALHAIRLFSPPGTPREDRWHLGILDYLNHEDYGEERFPRLILAHGDDFVITTKDYILEGLDWTPAPNTPWEYPAKIRISYTGNGYRLEGYYTSNILFDVTDIFAEIPAIIRNFLLTFMSRPVYIRNLGEFTGYLIMPDGRVETLHLYGPYEYLLAK